MTTTIILLAFIGTLLFLMLVLYIELHERINRLERDE